MAKVTDNFNRADTTDSLGTNWSPGAGASVVPLGITSNVVGKTTTDGTARVSGRYNAATFGADQYAQVKIVTLPNQASTYAPGPGVKISLSGSVYLGVSWNSAGSLVFKRSSGTTIGAVITGTGLKVGDVLAIKYYSATNTVEAFINNVSTGAARAVGATLTAGDYVGLVHNNLASTETAFRFDDFEGGDLADYGGGAKTLAIEAGVLTLAGQTIGLEAAGKLTAAAGIFTITGQSVGLRRSLRLPLGAGIFSLSGQNVGLDHTVPIGRLVSAPLKNNTGTLLANLTDVIVNVYDPLTGELVLRKTGQTTDAFGVCETTDVLLLPGTIYAVERDLSVINLGRRLPLYEAL